MSRAENAFLLRQCLVGSLKEKGYIRSPLVEAAFRAIPRHLFLPDVNLESVYRDVSFVTKKVGEIPVSSSSEPGIMAIMLEQLGLERGHRVLEIGAGTGYNAAVMAHIVGEGGRVVTIDIDEDIVESARQHLTEAGLEDVEVVCGDGGFGFPEAAPYDRIILTVASTEILPHWVEQLKPNGRIVLPVAVKASQKSIAFEKAPGHLISTSVADCGFMMLRGPSSERLNVVQLRPEPGLHLILHDQIEVNAEAVCKWLDVPGRDCTTGVGAIPKEVWIGLNFWLALHEPKLCTLWVTKTLLDSGDAAGLLPLRGKYDWNFANALLDQENLCLLMLPAQSLNSSDDRARSASELFVRSFGGEQDRLAQRLISHIQRWETAGRPATPGLLIRAYPQNADYAPSLNEIVVKKGATLFVFNWRTAV